MSYNEDRFTLLIDKILRDSDLNTISAKGIRKALSGKLGYDISEYKDKVNALIEQRFDKAHDAVSASTNPEEETSTDGTNRAITSPLPSSASPPAKRSTEDSDLSNAINSPKPKKKKPKISPEDEDAAYAARLQAEENNRSRPTRGGATRKKLPVKKQKKKSAAKIKDDRDAASGSEAEPQRKGGFHKPMNLSEPLAELLGETQLSRPQTVKKIWEYVKARDLQDPSDKRQIRCDDPMRAVFKTDRVHMFTMNKILNQNLYAVDE